MATTNIDSADLKGLLAGGVISEQVMNKIFDLSKIPLPFTDLIGKGTSTNSYKEWIVDTLGAPDVTNAQIDGADAGTSAVATDQREGNHGQISDKVVHVSYRASASDTFGRANELAYQVSRNQQRLRRDSQCLLAA